VRALWRRLDRPGHDAALLRPCGGGWRLSGGAVFLHESGPASLVYSVEVDGGWVAQNGRVTGFLGEKAIDHDIRREPGAWLLDGVEVEGLAPLVDLDFSFTPATNLLQLKRTVPQTGQRLSVPVAWFDLDAAGLSELPQIYEPLSASVVRYAAPTVPYQDLLEISADAFVQSYPGLWRREA
jgi:hypothetical protein